MHDMKEQFQFQRERERDSQEEPIRNSGSVKHTISNQKFSGLEGGERGK